jgi:hypothetical protein|tara:strand:- start:688 stop:1878 length:1191 start_codon:yes stop_codon:yes gene_type:complete
MTDFPAQRSEKLLLEGLNARDILFDIVQVAASSGAVVGTSGAGGDTITDTLFAASEASEILGIVTVLLAELGEVGAIIKSTAELDFAGNSDAFYDEVKHLLKRTVASQAVGDNARDLIDTAQKKVKEIIGKIVRAVSKWVAALLPDDFGLSGPAFEATMSGAIMKGAENSYDIANSGVEALGETGKLLTDSNALAAFLTTIAESVLGFAEQVDDRIQNPDPDKAGFLGSTLGGMQLYAETRPLIMIGAWAARQVGFDTDTTQEDYLNFIDKMHPKDPRRLVAQKMTPMALDLIRKAIVDWIPTAAAVMHKLISWLFAAIAIFQMVMNPEERKEILDVKTRDVLGIGDMFSDTINLPTFGGSPAEKLAASKIRKLEDKLLLRESEIYRWKQLAGLIK